MKRPPFGYKYKSGKLVPDKGEQMAIEAINILKENGFSLRDISTALQVKGYIGSSNARYEHIDLLHNENLGFLSSAPI